MQPRDLAHPDACDFLAGNPQELAMPEYVAAIQRALVPDSPSYYSYGPPFAEAIRVVAGALAERLGLDLDPADVFLTRGAASGLQLAMRAGGAPAERCVVIGNKAPGEMRLLVTCTIGDDRWPVVCTVDLPSTYDLLQSVY